MVLKDKQKRYDKTYKVSYEYLVKLVADRCPEMHIDFIRRYVSIFVDVMINRVVNNQVIIIDYFGTIFRKRHYYKLYDFYYKKIVRKYGHTIQFIPNFYFVKFLQEPNNRYFLKQRAVDNAIRYSEEHPKRGKRPVKKGINDDDD